MAPKRTALAVGVVALVTAPAALGVAQGWHVIGHGSASGDFAAAAASGTASHPHQLAVRVTGKGTQGFAAVACSKGYGIGSKSTHWSGSGLHLLKLPMKGSESCDVTASASGSGRVTVAILAR